MFISIWLVIVVACALIGVITTIVHRYEKEKKQLLEQHTTYVKNEAYEVTISWTCRYGTSLTPADETKLWIKILDLADYTRKDPRDFDWSKIHTLAEELGKTNVRVEPVNI